MNGKAAPKGAGRARLRIEKDSDAVFAAAIRSGVLSDDPDAADFAGNYMYMHHDLDGAAWFKHRETRAYVTMPPAAGTGDASGAAKAAAGPGLGLWATVVLAGAFLAGALVDFDRGGPRLGTVRLNDLTAEFYAGAVRDAGSPEAAAEAAREWGMRLETALDEVARRHGAVLLPVEAVAAGAGDYTAEVRAAMRRAAPGGPEPDTVATEAAATDTAEPDNGALQRTETGR